MAQPPPPTPAPRGPEPPPPNRSQQLVARSGFVLYEGGRTVFDESVLVFLSKPGHHRLDFDITDHVGLRLGAARYEGSKSFLATSIGPVTVYDPGGSQLLRVDVRTSIFSSIYAVSGTANGEYRSTNIGSWNQSIEANNEKFGSITGTMFDPHHGRLTILDHDDERVGVIRSFAAGSLFSPRRDFVVSIDPAVRGEFRRLLIVAPIVSTLLAIASSG